MRVVPSALRMRGSASNAAASQARAISMAFSGSISQSWYRSRSGISRAISAASAKPEHSSSEVCLAIANAAVTVSRIASGPLAEVLAEPLRWPT
ncbi:hypothetical protein D3C80_1741670 [compost metagenome]